MTKAPTTTEQPPGGPANPTRKTASDLALAQRQLPQQDHLRAELNVNPGHQLEV